MKFSTLSALSTLAGLTLAHPVDLAKRGKGFSNVDITILQFALTLEHLENTFYKEAFASFGVQDFVNAGFSEEFFVNLEFIAADESAHVQFLIAAIESAGVAPVQPCQYNFPVTDVASFVTLSAVLESIGTSAYLGAAPFVSSKQILGVAASIMATEALHTSAQRQSLGAIAAPNPFTTPLDANSVFTLASQFIVTCPPSNPPLPFTAFPGLTVNAQSCFDEVGSGSSGSFSTDSSANYATLVSNLESDTATAAYVTASANWSTTAEVTTTAEAATTTAAEAAATTTEEAAVTTAAAEVAATTEASTTTTMEMAAATTAAAPPPPAAPEKRSNLDARQSSCSLFTGGMQMQLVPDFSKSRGVDFSRIREIFVTIISGLDIISIQAVFGSDGSITVTAPSSIGGGQVFIFITTVDVSGRSLSDSQILFGPAVFEISPSVPTIIQ